MTSASASAFASFRFPRVVISVAVRWSLRYGLSYRGRRGVAFVEAARPRRHVPGGRPGGQVIDVWLSARRDLTAARTFFTRALATGAVPVEVTTDRAPAYPRILDELIAGALHDTEQDANNRVEADPGVGSRPGSDR